MSRNHVLTFVAASALAAFLISGCGSAGSEPSGNGGSSAAAPTADSGHEGHDHPSEGPHHGQLIELGGEEYHAEFIHDEQAGTVTVYVLDGAAKAVVPIEATEISINLKHDGQGEQFKLAASPDEGDPDGKSSRFVSDDPELGEDLHREGADAQLVLQIAGKAYRGKIEHDHAHHGHAHDDHAHDGHSHDGHSHDGHSHGEDDALVWRGETREHAGLQIRLGHHGKHLHAGETVEPAASVTRNGEPVSDLEIFNSLLSADGKAVLAEEVATVFEPTTKTEPAHYAQGALSIPEGVTQVIIRFRLVASDADDVTFDVLVTVE